MTREGSTGCVHQRTNALRRSLRFSIEAPRRPTESRVSAPIWAASRTWKPRSLDSSQSWRRWAYLSMEAHLSRGRSGTRRTDGIGSVRSHEAQGAREVARRQVAECSQDSRLKWEYLRLSLAT